jgi:hypothetical protein
LNTKITEPRTNKETKESPRRTSPFISFVFSSSLRALVALPLLLMSSGCAFPGIVAGKLMAAVIAKPKYLGLPGQSVGVLVWTDRGIQIDYPNLNLDLANSIQKMLVDSGKSDDLKGTIFPVQPASIQRYVLDHPNFDMRDVTEIAPKFGVTRLIYIEVEDFGTRAPASVELYRGHLNATFRIVEISGDHAKVAYEENNVMASFPPKVPEDGTPDGDDVRFYAGTVNAMSTEILNRLVSHELDDE